MITELANVVKDVGALLIEWREASGTEGVWEGSQFKAKADASAHQAMLDKLGALTRSNVPIISEEDPASCVIERPGKYWIIDPIDGTASYAHGFSGFVTQAALIDNGVPVIAAIYAPDLDEIYLAERGSGAYLNGSRLHVVSEGVGKTLVDNYPEPRGIASAAYSELNFTKYIECGSISLKICKVADGTADVFFKDVVVRDWDLAAPDLVLEESGGVLRNSVGQRIYYDGQYEHDGIVAGTCEASCTRVASWYINYKKRSEVK